MTKELFSLRNYAHLGDAIWEVFVREYCIFKTSNAKLLHRMTTERVNATFQKNMLEFINEILTDDEKEIARRGRNLPIPIGRKSIQHDYRLATAFEVLIGFWYIHDKNRLSEIYKIISGNEYFINR